MIMVMEIAGAFWLSDSVGKMWEVCGSLARLALVLGMAGNIRGKGKKVGGEIV